MNRAEPVTHVAAETTVTRAGHESLKFPRYRITNGFAIGSLDMFIQMVLGRV